MQTQRETLLEAARAVCPKHMRNGPCGGVTPGGMCEVNATLACPYLEIPESLSWRAPELPPGRPPRRSDGRLETALRAGEFVTIAEAYTPGGADLYATISRYESMKDRITAVNIAEHALATPRASTLAAAALFERAGIEAIINVTCRDRNVIALQGDLLGAAALGVKNVFCITGDHPALGDHPQATGVYELDSLGLIRLTRQLCDEKKFSSGRELDPAPRLFAGAAANPFSPPVELQAERVAAKVAAGTDFIQTQAVFDVAGFGGFVEQLWATGALDRAWLIVGVAPVVSLEGAYWLQREVPGARVPEELISTLSRAPEAHRRNAGLSYAAEQIHNLRETPGVNGVLLYPLLDDVESIAELLDLDNGVLS